MLPERPIWASDRPRVSGRLSTPASVPARLLSRPSSSQVIPSATTTSTCQRLHGRRSSRAGTSVSIQRSSATANPLRESKPGRDGRNLSKPFDAEAEIEDRTETALEAGGVGARARFGGERDGARRPRRVAELAGERQPVERKKLHARRQTRLDDPADQLV